MIQKYLLLVFIFFQSFQIQSQNIDFESLPSVDDYLVVKSNPEADTIIIGLHGGPLDNLALGEFEYFESISTFSVLELMQYQHINSEVLHDPNITLNQAVAMNDTTVAMIKKAVNHYNELDKVVVLIGHSFGGFLLHEYLDDYGISEKNIVISLGARFNLNQQIVDFLLLGHQFEFEEDGLTVDIDGIPPEAEKTTVTFVASLAQNRYVDSLQTKDLEKLMVVYGMLDQAIGRLLPDELEMLNNTNATVLELVNGGHSAPLTDQQSLDAIVYFIRNCDLLTNTNLVNEYQEAKVYPTITSEYLFIDTQFNCELNIYDSNGINQYNERMTQGIHKIQLPQLSDGYYLALIKAEGINWSSHRFLVLKNRN